MEFKNFIKKMREERNLSLTKMGELTGVSYGNLNNFENGVRGIPTIDVMDKISKGLNLSDVEKKELYSYRTPEIMLKEILKLKNEVNSNVKVISQENIIEMRVMAKASAGTGLININECLYTIQVKKNGFHKECYLIEVDGNSMVPILDDGSYVVVDPTQTEYIKNKIYVVLFEDKTYIKKIEILKEAKILIMRSINPEYEDIYISEVEMPFFKIMGRAVHYFNSGKL